MKRNGTIEGGRELVRMTECIHREWLGSLPNPIHSLISRSSAALGLLGVAAGLGNHMAQKETGGFMPTHVGVAAVILGGLALGYNKHFFSEG